MERSATQDLLAIRVGAQKFALRLAEVSGLFADKKITFIPGGSEYLLGIAGFRGVIAPVYNLQRIFGYPGDQAPRWLAIARTASVGFAFETFDGQLRVSPEAIAPRQRSDKQDLTSGVVHVGSDVRPVIELSRVLEVLQT